MAFTPWAAFDEYINGLFVPHDPALAGVEQAARQAGLPAIEVSPAQGALLHVLARSQRPTAILEMGTLAGYSTIWLARALEPGGRLVTLEVDPHHAEVARANFTRAGVADAVDLRLG